MTQVKEVDPLLSILIVNYNGKQFLGPCFDSIKKHLSLPYEIIVVDNASVDDSANFIQNKYPEVRLIRSELNRGFAAGNNLAAEVARGEYFLILNNDTLLLCDIKNAMAQLEADRTIGALGIKVLGREGEKRCSAGYFPTPWRTMRLASLFNKRVMKTEGQSCHSVDWIEGSFILTRRELWKKLNGMDQGYFMYVEDIDYCKRLKDAGFRSVYFPAASVVHYGGYADARLSMLIKSYRRYHKKFYSPLKGFIANGLLSLSLMLKVIFYALSSVLCGGEGILRVKARLKALIESPW